MRGEGLQEIDLQSRVLQPWRVLQMLELQLLSISDFRIREIVPEMES